MFKLALGIVVVTLLAGVLLGHAVGGAVGQLGNLVATAAR